VLPHERVYKIIASIEKLATSVVLLD